MLKYLSKLRSITQLILICALGIGTGYIGANYKKITDWFPDTNNFSSLHQAYDSKIILYGTETCPFCDKLRRHLREKNINFTDLYIEKSDKVNAQFKSLNEEAVPLLIVGNIKIVGFDKVKTDQALELVNK